MATNKENFDIIDKYFSKELRFIFDYIAEHIHRDFAFNEISPYIFLFGALERTESMLYMTLSTYLMSEVINKIRDELVELATREEIRTIKNREKPTISLLLKQYLMASLNEVRETRANLINSDHVLLAILRESEYHEEKKEISEIFKKYGVTYKILLDRSKKVRDMAENSENLEESKKENTENTEDTNITETSKEEKNGGTISTGFLIAPKETVKRIILDNGFPKEAIDKALNAVVGIGRETQKQTNTRTIPYCTNLNELAKKGKFDELIGRKNELKEIFRILGRRKSNNAILIGESGVGKTQIVNGLAQEIVNNTCPFVFRDREVWKFNATEMLAGTTLRGMFEERMISMIKTLRERKNAILFIDDIDSIFSEKTKNDYDVGGSISELFSDGDVQVIAATDIKGFKSITDSNPGLVKKFQEVKIEPLNENDSYEILLGNKKIYEKYHGVEYPDEIIKLCVDLSNRYITDKTLPSSAIDILDELGSYKKLNSKLALMASNMYLALNDVEESIKNAAKKDDFDKVREYENYKRDIRTDIARAEEELRSGEKLKITQDDLYETISQHTSIPIGKLKTSEKKELKNIEKKLKDVIIGQDEAVEVVSRAIKRNKIGLHQNTRPIGVFLFLGATGVGKTLLAKTLAKEIFGDEKYLVRFDMSEYNDKTSVNKLIGASAGYVGYNEGGLLTETIKRNKYAVLLIDEIEKSTEEIFNLFLQVFDEGFLTDNMGRKVDFKNTIIIMTSNVGTKKAGEHKALGFEKSDENNIKHSIITKELKNKFPPEFLNRIDEVIYFNNLTDDNLKEIIRLEINKLSEKIAKLGHKMLLCDTVIDYLTDIVKKEKEYGARPVIRAIRDNIENKLTDLIIDLDYPNIIFNIEIEDNKIKIVHEIR